MLVGTTLIESNYDNCIVPLQSSFTVRFYDRDGRRKAEWPSWADASTHPYVEAWLRGENPKSIQTIGEGLPHVIAYSISATILIVTAMFQYINGNVIATYFVIFSSILLFLALYMRSKNPKKILIWE